MLSAKDYITVTSMISVKEDLMPAIKRVNKDVIILADYDGVEKVQTIEDLNDPQWMNKVNDAGGGVMYMAAWGDYKMGSFWVPSLYFGYINYERWLTQPFDRWDDNLSDYAYAIARGDQVFNEDHALDIWHRSILEYISNCEINFNLLNQKDEDIYPNPISTLIWRDLKDQIVRDMHRSNLSDSMRQQCEWAIDAWRDMIESGEMDG